jgi:hypothetical protein
MQIGSTHADAAVRDAGEEPADAGSEAFEIFETRIT